MKKIVGEGEGLMFVRGLGRAGNVTLGVGDFDPTELGGFFVIGSPEKVDSAVLERAAVKLLFFFAIIFSVSDLKSPRSLFRPKAKPNLSGRIIKRNVNKGNPLTIRLRYFGGF